MLVCLQAHYVKLDVQALVKENGRVNIQEMELMNVNLQTIVQAVVETGGDGINILFIKSSE
jgi:hypothetical protein